MVPKLDTGVGGARKRWKLAKFTMAGILLTLGVTSLGTVANWQLVVSSRSIGNASLVIPISTLYASPEKISRDGFCAFQPNRPMRPSLPLRLTRPLMPKLFLMNEFALRLLRIAVLEVESMSPVPNGGGGVWELMLRDWIGG